MGFSEAPLAVLAIGRLCKYHTHLLHSRETWKGLQYVFFQDVLTTETLIAFYPGIVLHQVVIKLPEWVFLERRTQDGPRVLCIPLSGCIP